MKNATNTRITWWLLMAAIALHVMMISRALYITAGLRNLSHEVDRRQRALTATLGLTNSMRAAEETIRRCSADPSAKLRAAYCEALAAADAAAMQAGAAGAVSPAFSEADISALRAELAERRNCCAASAGAPGAQAAKAEFDRFYDTASALRRKLSAHSASGLKENARLSGEAREKTLEMVVSSSLIATFILGLMGWVVYSMRRMNRILSEQRDEILTLKNGIEQAPMAVVITDTSGTIQYVNPAFTVMYGYSFSEAVGKTPRVLKSGTMPQAIYPTLWKSLLAGKPWAGELENKAKDGTLLWVKAFMSPVRGESGSLTHFISLHKDVTLERRLRQEVLEAKQEAERANQAKSDFLASMSHEIRTPLNAIVGMSELIDESGLTKEQGQYLSIMRNASDTLLSLINDILDISKIESGKVDLETAPFNLEELVSKVSEMTSVRAFKKNVEVNCSISPDVPVMVEGDATRLRQVLMNLMGNAVKFVEKGWVSLEVRKDCSETDGCRLLFSVRDTGIGIPADKLDSVFEKFTQADSSTTRKYGGTGLGLPISKMLVELMGGSIRVESTPGVGTVFFFALKLREQTGHKAVYLPKADVKELKGKRFLVVDDNQVNRIIIRDIVHSWGAFCDGAESGEGGLAALREARLKGAPYQGIFVDFNMPGMDGREFCARVSSEAAISPKPAMALVTSDTIRFKKADFCEAGVTAFIAKPVRKQTILEGAQEMLGSGVCEPAGQRKAEAAKAGVLTREDLPELSLLIVDDSEDNRILMSSFLKGSKVKLQLAVDGIDALEKLKAAAYDLVFMDMQMPGMDGFTATGKFRELEAASGAARTKVVALTAMATREDVDKALKAGCDDYLTKPIRKNTFYSYLVNFAAGRKAG
jgi:PAS domain S-box-containing protein